jgi:hypothetical protein
LILTPEPNPASARTLLLRESLHWQNLGWDRSKVLVGHLTR